VNHCQAEKRKTQFIKRPASDEEHNYLLLLTITANSLQH